MSPQEYYEKVEDLAKQALFTRDAIRNTLSDRVRNLGMLEDEEEQKLYDIFDSICTDENGSRYLSQSAFISVLHRLKYLPLPMFEAGGMIYRCLINISQAPFYQNSGQKLILDGLLWSLVWTDCDRSSRVYEESEDSRTRYPTDTQRIIYKV